jgi:hypothetical protein
MPVCFIVVPANELNTLVEWQVSHGMLVGICAGLVPLDTGFIPTAKVWPLWQDAQPLTIPRWFILERDMLYPAEWQSVQGCIVGK